MIICLYKYKIKINTINMALIIQMIYIILKENLILFLPFLP